MQLAVGLVKICIPRVFYFPVVLFLSAKPFGIKMEKVNLEKLLLLSRGVLLVMQNIRERSCPCFTTFHSESSEQNIMWIFLS